MPASGDCCPVPIYAVKIEYKISLDIAAEGRYINCFRDIDSPEWFTIRIIMHKNMAGLRN